jgi:hypothetical protein
MNRPSGVIFALIALLIPSAPLIFAAEQSRSDPGLPSQALPTSSPPARSGGRLTGKERLGEKWQDEQRLDNCNVPIDKRGAKPRPDACPSTASE